ncbi:zf-HC2 domain-containing protein [Microaerobacter geothermalis]|uniref:anti-sigma factor family protein n=1 Tax=Microaerobacter geothermalis TaxID=674972 RepID=UPI001F203EB2|nr:zf-HC2 domain-containing protein [Microaerobacter geothermalis]MCF6092874.1 zf-HC2 domain-containing protein [Microaerobacter geothermalis]
MTCDEVMELIQRDLDRDLYDEEKILLSSHLATCPDCSKIYDRMKGLSDRLEQLPRVTPAYSLVDKILPELEHSESPSVKPNRKRFLWAGAAIAAGILFAIPFLNNPQINNFEMSKADMSQGNDQRDEEKVEQVPAEAPQIAAKMAPNHEGAPDLSMESVPNNYSLAAPQIFSSPNGEYRAFISNEGQMQLVIETNKGEIVFLGHSWDPTFNVNIKWLDSFSLQYRIGEDEIWQVNLKNLTERQIQN